MNIQDQTLRGSLIRRVRSRVVATILGIAAIASQGLPANAREPAPFPSLYPDLPGDNETIDVYGDEQLNVLITPDQVLVEIEETVYVLPPDRELGVCVAGQDDNFTLSIEAYDFEQINVYRDGLQLDVLSYQHNEFVDFNLRTGGGAPIYQFGGSRSVSSGDDDEQGLPEPPLDGGGGLTPPAVIVKPVDDCPTGRNAS